jgi:hypothetical protein
MELEIKKTILAASCPLGISTKEYESGKTAEIFDELAEVFITEGWGVKVMSEIENKAIFNVPENKSKKDKK